ncbi:Putative AC transposase [Linum perenne]
MEAGNGNQQVDQQKPPTDVEAEVVTPPIQSKHKSTVWLHFERDKVHDIWKAKCNNCRKFLGGDSNNGTSHLKSHIKSCIQKRIHDGSQKVLGPNLLSKGKTELVATASNLFFPRICDLRVKICEWIYDPNVVISNMAQSMWSKFSKYWDGIHHILAVAIVLDPRYKLEIVEYYAEKIGHDDCGFSADSMKQVLCDLILEYQSSFAKNQSSCGVGSSALEDGNATSNDRDFELFLTQRKKARTTAIVTELDNYLNEDVLPRYSEFDILMWWKLRGLKYPILQAIARAVLAIPVTFVASESAFSSGGRLLDPHRSKLHFATVEALMCTRSWLKDEYERGKVLSIQKS